MSTKIKLLCVFAFVSILYSCSEEDEKKITDPIGEMTCKPTSIDFGGDEEFFTWNGSQLTKITFMEDTIEDGHYEIQYGADGKISKVLEYEEHGLESTRVFEYGSNGQWSKITQTDADTTQWVFTATYDGDMRSKVVIVFTGDQSTETDEEVYTYTNGNLTKKVSTYTYETPNGEQSYTTTSVYEYNDKVNTLAPVEDLINTVFWAEATPSKNFETKQTTTQDDGGESVTTTSYVFNDKGFPTSITETYNYDGGQEIETVEFAYECK